MRTPDRLARRLTAELLHEEARYADHLFSVSTSVDWPRGSFAPCRAIARA